MAVLPKATAKARKLYPTGSQAQALWGCQVHGVSPSRLRTLTAAASRATGLGSGGSCTTTAIRLCFGDGKDPVVKARVLLLVKWARTMAAYPDIAIRAGSSWDQVKARLGAGNAWMRAKCSMSACIATLLDIGWESLTPTSWRDPKGSHWKVGGANLSTFAQEVTSTIDANAWEQAAEHPQGAGLECGGDLSVPKNVIRSLGPALIGMAEHVVAGACWGENRRFLCGYRPDGICRRCLVEVDTDLHRIRLCGENQSIEGAAVSESEHLVPEATAGCNAFACFWTGGIVPSAWLRVPPPDSHRAVRWVKGPAYVGLGPGVYCTDSSGGAHPQDPMLRRCGWGWVQISSAGWGWASYGPLGGSSQPAPRAEMVAVIQVDDATTGDISIYADYANIVSGIAKGHVRCAFLSNSDLWEDIWAAVRTHAGTVSVFKIPAHADEDAVLTCDVPREAIVGNCVADAVADRESIWPSSPTTWCRTTWLSDARPS